MRRVILLIIMAFLISGGTIGILYQEGMGGIERRAKDTTETQAPANLPTGTTTDSSAAVTAEDVAAAEAEAEAAAEAAKAEEEAKKAEEEAAAAEAAKAEEEAKKAEEEAKAAEEFKAKKEEGAPYYSVEVTGNLNMLNVYDVAENGEPIGNVNKGEKGYLIEETDGHRDLIYIDGKIVYASKMYLTLTEIPTDEYPDELLEVTADDAGKDVSDRVKEIQSQSESSSEEGETSTDTEADAATDTAEDTESQDNE